MDRPLNAELAARLVPGARGGVVEFEDAGSSERTWVDLAEANGADLVRLHALTTKAAVLDAFAIGLSLPGWWGGNWDALDELLAFPEPSTGRPTLIVWSGMDALPVADASAFRDVIASAIGRRRPPDGPIVLVIVRSAMSHASGVPDHIRGLGKVHHVALIVASIDDALGFWRDALGLELETVMDIEHDRVRIAFLGVGESKVELVEPTDDTTGVARFLAGKGEGFHHVCFEVPNLAETLRQLGIDGLELIDTAPRRGAEGPVAFLHPRSCHGVLVELIEAPGGPAWATLGFSAPV